MPFTTTSAFALPDLGSGVGVGVSVSVEVGAGVLVGVECWLAEEWTLESLLNR